MLSCCLKWKRNTKSINPSVWKTSNGQPKLLSKFSVCNSKNSRFITLQDVGGLLGQLGIKIILSLIYVLWVWNFVLKEGISTKIMLLNVMMTCTNC